MRLAVKMAPQEFSIHEANFTRPAAHVGLPVLSGMNCQGTTTTTQPTCETNCNPTPNSGLIIKAVAADATKNCSSTVSLVTGKALW